MSLTVVRETRNGERAGLSICLDRENGRMIADFTRAKPGAPLAWEHGITVPLGAVALAQILEVFRGHTESIADGKGIYMRNAEGSTVLRLAHTVEPLPGYLFDVLSVDAATGHEKRVQVRVRPDEAFALSLGIDMAISELVCRRA